MDAAELSQFLSLFDRSEVRVSLFDGNDRLRYANRSFRAQFGLAENATPTWKEMMLQARTLGVGTKAHTDDFSAWLNAALSRRGKFPFKGFPTDMLDSRWLWMTETVNEQGWMLCIAPEITSFMQQSELHTIAMDRDIALRSANTDYLTGAMNRRALLSSLQLIIEEHSLRSVCLLMLDIDHFKLINDTHGHDVGDQVLKHFVELCASLSRRNDLFGRIGGEEFAFLLPGTSVETGLALFTRLQSALNHTSLEFGDGNVRYTCSGGISCSIAGDTPQSLMKRADTALYHAKKNGRNRCHT